MRRLLVIAPMSVMLVPAVALAAPTPGKYSGTSSGKYIQVGQAEEPTDKGKVTFKVKNRNVLDFKLRDQLVQCGPPAEVPVTVGKIKLNSAGKGSALYQDPSVGTLKVTIAVSSKGKASGTIRRPESASGVCYPDYPVRFTAKKR
jgi:hypothetical protein